MADKMSKAKGKAGLQKVSGVQGLRQTLQSYLRKPKSGEAGEMKEQVTECECESGSETGEVGVVVMNVSEEKEVAVVAEKEKVCEKRGLGTCDVMDPVIESDLELIWNNYC